MPQLTSHELAKKLLEGPDLPVFFNAFELPEDLKVKRATIYDDCVILGEESSNG